MNKREIKFRIWDKQTKKFDYCDFSNNDLIGLVGYRNYPSRTVPQQFTGLLDKNGKEIYEGDIILFNDDERLLIEWNPESAAFMGIIYLEHDGDSWREPDFDAARSLDEFCGDEEVIGNMFENPTLLQP